MCVANLIQRKCHVTKRTSKAKLRQRDNVSSCKSSNRRARRMKREEEVDLLCSELLSQSDAKSYQADLSYFKLECEPLSPLIIDIPSAFCAAVDPYLYSLLPSPEFGDRSYLQQRLWTSVDRVPSPLGSAQEISMGMGAGDYRARDNRCWNDEGLIDGVDWHAFSPDDHFSVPIATLDMWQCMEAYLPYGSSLQSNSLSSEEWAAQASAPFCNDTEQRCTELVASTRSRKKPECSVSSEPATIFTSHNERGSIRNTVRNSVPNASVGAVEFREAMEFLLEKESSESYQLSGDYVKRLTTNYGKKLEINGIQSIRRDFVKWILKVVEHLQLSLLTAAHALSLFDRHLAQTLVLDAQIEDKEELLIAATACVWIAAKMEDSCVPHLSCIRELVAVGFDEARFRKMEVVVLSSLGWRTLGATASDYLSNMIAQLPALGLPADLLPSLGCRSEEVMRVLLPEVEFLAYQPSVVSFSLMQCLLDEYVPVQTASLMAAFHLALAVDVESKEECNRAVRNLMKSTKAPTLLRCAKLKNYNDLHSDSCNPDTLKEQTMRVPVFAF